MSGDLSRISTWSANAHATYAPVEFDRFSHKQPPSADGKREDVEASLGREMPITMRMQDYRRSLTLHEASGRWMAVYRHRLTNQVEKTVPEEAILDAIGRVRTFIGRLIDWLA